MLLPLIGTAQVLLVGDTDRSGGWINGPHGLSAILVVVLAGVLAEVGRRSLGSNVTAPAG